MKIRDVTEQDAGPICDIYNWYVVNTIITFEEQPVDTETMIQRIGNAGPERPWLVWEDGGKVQGYAYAGEWKSRCSYRYSVETTVYVDRQCRAQGIGSGLYRELISRLSTTQVHALIAGIALPNDHSVALHEKMGFGKVAQFHEVGWKFQRWIDVGYWELLLGRQA